MQRAPTISGITVTGLALILLPILTVLHEQGGHALACLATGSELVEISAYYVKCHDASPFAGRIVAFAGVTIQAIAALIVYRIEPRVDGSLARLTAWLFWLCCGLAAAGYLLFSGIGGIGDLAPGEKGGLGPMDHPWLWRAGVICAGIAAYPWLVRRGNARLDAILGQGPDTRQARRMAAHLPYLIMGIAAVLVSLRNPVGIVITLVSAAASSFGGNAGLISVGYATLAEGVAKPFSIAAKPVLLVLGLAMTLLFALVLGGSIQFSN